MRPLATLPKAHLHLHLEGGMRPETLKELALQYGIDAPGIRGFLDFADFARMYLTACEVLRTSADLERLVHETVVDAAEAGATYVEPSIYPPNHNDRLGPDEALLETVIAAGEAASATTGVAVGWMMIGDRTLDPARAVEQAKLAARYAGRGVVSFGLANDEARFPPEPFAEAFSIARDAGLISAPHAGELAGPESVRGAIDVLGAQRLQHGIRAVEDVALVERLAAESICCDVCPTSNLMLKIVTDLDEHPLRQLLEAGVPCSLNADDPLLFGPGLLEEYTLVRDRMGFADEQMAAIARASIIHSGAPEEIKARSLEGIDAWLMTEL